MSDDGEARKTQTRAFFNTIASEYDATGVFVHFGRRLVACAGVEPGHRVLDAASGRGAVLFPAAERVASAGEVIGFDLSEAMVQETNAEALRRGLAARACVMDAEHLDFPDAAFDIVLCGFGIMFFPQLERALSEFRRVLKPDGRLGVSTWRPSFLEDIGAVLNEVRQRATAAIPPTTIGTPLTSPDAVVRPLALAGFSDVQASEESTDLVFADIDAYWENARGTGQRRTIDALDAEQTAWARAALAERLRPGQRSDGIHVTATAIMATACR